MVPVRRHARHWGTYLAGGGLGLALLLPIASEAQQPSQPRQTHGSQNGTKNDKEPNSPNSQAGASAPVKTNASDNKPQASSKKSGGITNSAPAWAGQFLGRLVGDPTALFTAVLTISTILLWRETRRLAKGAEIQGADFKLSMEHMKTAADAAGLSAVSAEASVKAYRDAERAWVGLQSVDTFPFSGQIDGIPVNNGVFFQIKFVNAGRTPALNFSCWLDHRVVDRNSSEIPVFSKRPIRDGIKRSTALVPQIPIASTPIALSDFDTGRLRRRETKIILWGLAEYEDSMGSGQIRTTECCSSIEFNGSANNLTTGATTDRYNIMPVGPQNGAT